MSYLRNQFRLFDMGDAECAMVQKILKKYLMGIAISRSSGDVLYYLKIDDSIKIDLFSQFIAALSMFGEEIGNIRKISIEGLNIEMGIFAKHDLIISAFFRPDMVDDYLEQEAERCLDMFYSQFQQPIDNNRCNQDIYERFDNEMCHIIRDYLYRIGALKENN